MDMVKNILGIVISLSTVFGIFTGIINKMFSKKLKPIENRIDQERKDSIKHDLGQLRYLVVSFANDLRNGVPKSRFQFEAVFGFMDEYEEMINQLHIKNGLFAEEESFIREQYRKLEKD